MDSTTLLLIIVPLVLGLVFNAVRFMRFVGFLAGAGRRGLRHGSGNAGNGHLSFDERVAERLRELEPHGPPGDRSKTQISPGFGRRQV